MIQYDIDVDRVLDKLIKFTPLDVPPENHLLPKELEYFNEEILPALIPDTPLYNLVHIGYDWRKTHNTDKKQKKEVEDTVQKMKEREKRIRDKWRKIKNDTVLCT